MIAGALLGDFVKGPLRGEYESALERGIRLHRELLQHAFLEFYPRVLSMAQDFRQ